MLAGKTGTDADAFVRESEGPGPPTQRRFPLLLTADETARILRTTRAAIYQMVARVQLPGVTRVRRRVLFRTADLLDWLDQNRAPSPTQE